MGTMAKRCSREAEAQQRQGKGRTLDDESEYAFPIDLEQGGFLFLGALGRQHKTFVCTFLLTFQRQNVKQKLNSR